ncbi:MAG TPA: glycoside hydrolase family 2 TIM barrel-domain containing protein [Pirellulales bacterium]|jgi:beta-galactosidase|nr:glycoside hydrolase family 2 TIM barrel-domain containing protein [Pirellulales bacterium]
MVSWKRTVWAVGLLFLGARSIVAGDGIWLEGEQPSHSSLPTKIESCATPAWLSAGKWLMVNIDADKVEKEAPQGGTLRYDFTAAQTGKHEVWNRVGFEAVRSPFEWRIDDGPWKTIAPQELSTDLYELSVWMEAAWVRLGETNLTVGAHQLEIRLPLTHDDKGKVARILYASDALLITPTAFHPHGPLKPGEQDRTPADEAAAKHVFDLPAAKSRGDRSSVLLKGDWEICRNDEQLPGDVAEPIKDFPPDPQWHAIAVPGDKNTLRPELLMAHRLWYRTRVKIPANLAGRSFFMTFPQNSLNTTVYVNGQYCGFNKFPYVHFDLDVTKGIKPGEINEVWVGIRDAWYAYSTKPGDPMKLRKMFNLPPSFASHGFQDLAWPVWNAWKSGILVTPSLTAAGPAYVSDAFAKPSVAKGELAIETTVSNPSSQPIKGEIQCEAIDLTSGKVAKAFSPKSFIVAGGASSVVELVETWKDAKLWWPDAPQLYRLRTTLQIGGQPRDTSEIRFGFREWGHQGKNFTLNGIPWHGWNMGVTGSTPEQWLENYRRDHQTMMRLCGAAQGGSLPFFGMSPDEALDWMDEHGVPVRRCGILDGEAIGYMAIENDPDLQKLYGSKIKMQLLNNWVEQMAAQVKAERNHPSIQVWSIENEWLYINCINLYGNLMDDFERMAAKCAAAVNAVDPTRLAMTDGGGANKDQSMQVHCNHYVAGPITTYPETAYLPNPTGGGRGRWVWDEQRPRYLGEDFYFTGNHPELATIGGEAALGGKAATLEACGLMVRILQQGYRWAGYGAWDFYLGPNDTDGSQWRYFQPRVALVREWDWSFGAGQTVQRTVGVFNDTHSDEPIKFTCVRQITGQADVSESSVKHVAPGTHDETKLRLELPPVPVRAEGAWILTLEVGGKEVFRDRKPFSILPAKASGPVAAALAGLKATQVLVDDPDGAVDKFLTAQKIPFTPIHNLKTLDPAARLLIVGKNALDAEESASSHLAAWASAGKAVIVLEQEHPLRFQALPAEIETAQNIGRVGFAEDLDHPVFAGLAQADFFTWGSDEILYRNAYAKPTRGAKSLLQCDELLKNSALVEVPAGHGLLLLSQLTLGEKLAENAVAQRLLENLMAYGATYKQSFRAATAVVQSDPQWAKAIDAIGLQCDNSEDPLAALAKPNSIALISATPDHLKTLAAHLPEVKKFTQGGGWIVFSGLTPAGLDAYNAIVGWQHMIRPFKRERVFFPANRSPLAAGITTGDVAMYSSQRIFSWTEGNYVVSDEFKYVIDYDEVAPFAKSSFSSYDNIVNGFTNADGWPLIINFGVPKSGPFDIELKFPKPQTITEFTWIGNLNYWPTTKLNLRFAGDQHGDVALPVQPTGDPQTFPLDPPRTAQEMTLQLTEWQPRPGVNGLIGIDNIYLKAQRPPEFYQHVKPLLNVGGLMAYPEGNGADSGGILLCNLNFKETEEVPANAAKKRTILTALLHNLRAPFSGGKSVIAGANLQYAPIDISKQANAFRNEQGWFGDKQFTFRDLPTGKQMLAGVQYDIYEFATSPVPTAIVLDGPRVPNHLAKEVTGIPVERKADALFFLQAARLDRRRNPDERKHGKKLEVARYVVHYANGTSETIPVYSEIDVDDYRQTTPAPLPGAQIAWTRPYEKSNQTAVAYSMQWTNPHPDLEIKSIDILPGADQAGVPAVLAITAATAAGK